MPASPSTSSAVSLAEGSLSDDSGLSASVSRSENRGRTPADQQVGTANSQLSGFEIQVIAVFVDAVQGLGLPKSYGEIYGLLFASAEPLGFSEIHARLSISKGSVSQGIKALRTMGAVKVELSPIDQRERYHPQLELRQLVIAFLQRSVEPQLKLTEGRLREAKRLLPKASASHAERKLLEDRLSKLQTWRRKAAGLLPWITKFLG